MPNQWQVTSNYINGKTVYQVCCIIDPDAVDHAGNRKYLDGIYDTAAEAQLAADIRNGMSPMEVLP